MAGYWPSSLFFFFLRFYEQRRSRGPLKRKNRTMSISSHLNRTSLVNKGLLYGQKIAPKNFAFARTKREMPSGQDRSILPAQVANQNTGFASSCPLAEPAI